MEFSFEIPMPHLKEYLSVSDFPFGLAHLMLDTNFKHAGTYHSVMENCLLDNSMYELGDNPLSNAELIEAAKVCHPVSIIAPDWMDDMYKTVEAVHNLKPGYPTFVGGVVQGKDLEERIECFHILQDSGARPICFPFRTPRAETIGHLHAAKAFKEGEWYHLLGLQQLWELSWTFPGRWSMDTAKPFKGEKLSRNKLRGLGRLDLHKELTEHDRLIAHRNIAFLRKKR